MYFFLIIFYLNILYLFSIATIFVFFCFCFLHNLQITNIDPVKRDRVVSLRCSPRKFVDLVKATPDEIKDRLRAMGFGGLLEFKPTSLPRMLLIWLMDKFNPESMSLELGMGKVIEINEHAVWCMFMLNRVGNDPQTWIW